MSKINIYIDPDTYVRSQNMSSGGLKKFVALGGFDESTMKRFNVFFGAMQSRRSYLESLMLDAENFVWYVEGMGYRVQDLDDEVLSYALSYMQRRLKECDDSIRETATFIAGAPQRSEIGATKLVALSYLQRETELICAVLIDEHEKRVKGEAGVSRVRLYDKHQDQGVAPRVTIQGEPKHGEPRNVEEDPDEEVMINLGMEDWSEKG